MSDELNPIEATAELTTQDLERLVPEFKAAGAQRSLTLKEVIEYAKKGLGADAAMREAAERRKTADAELQRAQSALGVTSAIDKLRDPDASDQDRVDAFARVAQGLGITDMAGAQRLWNSFFPEDATTTSSPDTPAPAKTGGKLRLEDLPDQVLELLAPLAKVKAAGIDLPGVLTTSQNAVEYTARERAVREVQAALKRDPEIRRALRGRAPGAEAELVKRTMSALENRVASGKPVADALAEAVADTRTLVATLAPPAAEPDPTALLGVGVGPGAAGRFQVDKPPTLKPDDYGKSEAMSNYFASLLARGDAANAEADEHSA